jgi:hypothetical protein
MGNIGILRIGIRNRTPALYSLHREGFVAKSAERSSVREEHGKNGGKEGAQV